MAVTDVPNLAVFVHCCLYKHPAEDLAVLNKPYGAFGDSGDTGAERTRPVSAGVRLHTVLTAEVRHRAVVACDVFVRVGQPPVSDSLTHRHPS